MALSLIDVCNKNVTTERKQAYWNTYHCQSKIVAKTANYMATIARIGFAFCVVVFAKPN